MEDKTPTNETPQSEPQTETSEKAATNKSSLSSAWHWCRRYVSLIFVALLGLYIYVLFFNDNSYARLHELQEEINRLEEEIKENTDSANYYRELNERLNTSPEEMERVAREYYDMQRPGEDVYIVE